MEGEKGVQKSTRKSLPELESGAPQKSEFDDENMVGLSKFRLRFGGRWACEKNGNILIGLAKVEFASITCLVRFYFREFQITLTTPNDPNYRHSGSPTESRADG